MKAGVELDALVAEFVMEWTRWRDPELGTDTEYWNQGGEWAPFQVNDDKATGPDIWAPSTSIADAWEVAEHLMVRMQISSRSDDAIWLTKGYLTDEWACQFNTPGGFVGVKGEDTAPLAICLAALKAVGHPLDE